jgi:hypothetical protein
VDRRRFSWRGGIVRDAVSLAPLSFVHSGLVKILCKRTVSQAARKGLDLLPGHECGARHGHQNRPPDTFRPDFGDFAGSERQERGRIYREIGPATCRRSMETHDERSA